MKRFLWTGLALLAACTGSNGSAESSQDAQTAVPAFNADSAYAYLVRQVGFGPRVANTTGHQQQLAWMVDFLKTRADTVYTQPFTHITDEGEELQMANVIARFNPQSDTRVLLLAHWDTRPTADEDPDPVKRKQPIPGANDGASGVAVLLELANVLKNHSAPIGVDLLFTDGEDYGPHSANMYLGATHFAANLPPGYKPLYGILLDMIGDRNPVFPQEGNSVDMAPEVVQRVWRTARDLGLERIFPLENGGYITDDHIPLNRAGIRTIDIIDFDRTHWHKSTDNVENTSPRGLDAVGRVLTTLIYRGG